MSHLKDISRQLAEYREDLDKLKDDMRRLRESLADTRRDLGAAEGGVAGVRRQIERIESEVEFSGSIVDKLDDHFFRLKDRIDTHLEEEHPELVAVDETGGGVDGEGKG